MKEIKFRAWDKKKKKFWHDIEREYDTLGREGEELNWEVSSFGSYLDNERYIVQQFTNLKDKNGKEIFESDLISYGVGNLEVIYQEGAFGYKNIEGDFCLLSNHNKDLEVVGNIYEK